MGLGCAIVLLTGVKNALAAGRSLDPSAMLSQMSHPWLNTAGVQPIGHFFGSATFLFSVHVAALPILQALNSRSLPAQNAVIADVSVEDAHVEAVVAESEQVVEDRMRSERKRLLVFVFFTLAMFNCIFGTCGALLYFSVVAEPSATGTVALAAAYENAADVLLLINDSNVITAIKCLIVLDLLCTLPLMLLVARRAVEHEARLPEQLVHWCCRRVEGSGGDRHGTEDTGRVSSVSSSSIEHTGRHLQWATKLLRVLLVVFAASLASLIPNFGELMSIISGLTCCALGYLLPGVLYGLIWIRLLKERQAVAEERCGTVRVDTGLTAKEAGEELQGRGAAQSPIADFVYSPLQYDSSTHSAAERAEREESSPQEVPWNLSDLRTRYWLTPLVALFTFGLLDAALTLTSVLHSK